MKSIIVLIIARIIALFLFSMTLSAFAHGDEDHGAAAAPVLSQNIAPRALASTDEFEVVVVLDGKQLRLYVDQFASNAPVVHAKVEVEGAGVHGVAAEAAPGLYVMNVAALAPARYPLTISIESGETSDLLAAELDTSLPAAQAVAKSGWTGWTARLIWISAGVLLLLALAAAAAAMRRQQVNKGN